MVKRNTLLISKGDPATEMYFVVRGSAVVLAAAEDKPSESHPKISSKPGNPGCVLDLVPITSISISG